MDIKTTPPEEYASWLLNQGVPEEEIGPRMASDALKALSLQLSELCSPVLPGETLEEFEARFEAFKAEERRDV